LPPIEPTIQALAALDESAAPKTRKTIRSSAGAPPSPDTITALRTEATTLAAELVAASTPQYNPP
jgi:hypothetical protein